MCIPLTLRIPDDNYAKMGVLIYVTIFVHTFFRGILEVGWTYANCNGNPFCGTGWVVVNFILCVFVYTYMCSFIHIGSKGIFEVHLRCVPTGSFFTDKPTCFISNY